MNRDEDRGREAFVTKLSRLRNKFGSSDDVFANMQEQRSQIEILWQAMKILKHDAEFHDSGMSVRDEFSPRYVRWSGRAWASFDFLDRMLRQRLSLFSRTLHGFGKVDVGKLALMTASITEPEESDVEADVARGEFFETAVGKRVLIDATMCDHSGESCPKRRVEIVD